MKTLNELKKTGVDLEYGAYCDHTVLRAFTTSQTIKEFCREAVEYKAAAVCVNPVQVALAKECLAGTGVKTATVIGFPLGANKPSVKAFEAAEAVADGADEVDMVINIAALREKNDALVLEDIQGVVNASKGKAKVKVIIETCYLTREEKIRACQLALQAGADFVKTSTGMAPGGATVEDIRLMKEVVGDKMEVKASSGIDDRAIARAMIEAGATRLGTSKTPQIVSDDPTLISATKRHRPPTVS